MKSSFDCFYRSFILTKIFTKGWGHPDNIKRILEFRKVMSDRDQCQKLVDYDYPIFIDKVKVEKDMIVKEGHFVSPLMVHVPSVIPKEVEIARFKLIEPLEWKTNLKPMCIHLAGTGDHKYNRRMRLAKPLLHESCIGSIILENPFYGCRKPKDQMHSSLNNVSDLFVMGGTLMLESLALLYWCERQGYGPLGISGISMGGHMASLAATNYNKPISLIPCMSWTTASSVFTEGVLSDAIPWKLLYEQYESDVINKSELIDIIHSPEFDIKQSSCAYRTGKTFVQNYPTSLDNMIEIDEITSCDMNEKNIPLPQKYPPGDNSKSFCEKQQTFLKDRGKKSSSFSDNWLIKTLHFRNQNKSKFTRLKLKEGTLDFMRGIMDECTHLGNFSIPMDTSLIIIVLAKQDAYIPINNVESLQKIWPGAEVRMIDAGHIYAYLFNQDIFRKAIVDSFNRQIEKYITPVSQSVCNA